ncbi:MAG: hypothetical protein GX808_04000 [Syntrophomonadaceae bacterium]|jgi:hypothetical protein|nr:hypothetical protein [Syntrophomonadaceae bacterium]
MLKFNPTTPMQFYYAEGEYVSGQGMNRTWELIESEPYNIFYGEWKGSYGDRSLAAESLGVKDSATVRTFYNPVIYAKLRGEQVVVIKNADSTAIIDGVPDRNNPNVYELWGGVDNMKEENLFLEFRVRRYEGL